MELCQGIRENISTHALTEGDSWPKCTTTISGLFQLTPSRRATVEEAMPVIAWKHISTHALTEGDVPTGKSTGRNGPFQLTPSRRATLPGIHRNLSRGFQLTPSRRATSLQLESSALPEYFNSRPHGGRRKLFQMRFLARLFQLTPSRRATRGGIVMGMRFKFQLTPSRRATAMACASGQVLADFNSRPHGGRLAGRIRYVSSS